LRSRVKTETKKALQAAASAKPPEAQEQARTAVSTIDKAATKGAIHRNKAARLKSRVMKRLAAVKG
jgi:small subunit ribosomal protein S20